MKNNIVESVSRYYTDKVFEYGPTPRGVDWNGEESQLMRFRQLIKIIDAPESFSVTDFGCGYGALYNFLKDSFKTFLYVGYDISAKMIQEAMDLHRENPSCVWTSEKKSLKTTDYSIASGIFNVRLAYNQDEWQEYVLETLQDLDQLSAKGFSFNMLTSYSNEDRKRKDLYYADPAFYFDHCKKHFSRYVALLHDYPLWEFTILVRKEGS